MDNRPPSAVGVLNGGRGVDRDANECRRRVSDALAGDMNQMADPEPDDRSGRDSDPADRGDGTR